MDPDALKKAAASLSPDLLDVLLKLSKDGAPDKQQSNLQVPTDATTPVSQAIVASALDEEARLALKTAPSSAHAGAPPSSSRAKKRKSKPKTAEEEEEGLFKVSALA